jgi:outer membrane protein OmpA-like peptidoglycan-associated protein
MTEHSGSAAKPLLAAVLVLVVALPAGYYGFHMLMGQQTETHSVVLDMKTETLNEIRSIGTKTADELKKLNDNVGAGGADRITAELQSLKQMTEAIQAQQKAMSEGMNQLLSKQGGNAMGVRQTAPDENVTIAETLYFDIAKSGGPLIDKGVAKIVPTLKEHMGKAPCRIYVTGFADTLGNDLSNLKLSNERADYVAAKLRAAGLEVYSVEAWGERRLKINTYDGVKNENNRRVVIEMHCGKKMPPSAQSS